jgi:hypothetical protein
MSRLRALRHLLSTGGGVSPLAIVHDTRWGTSTDANGWITQNLGAGNRAIYLDTVNGNDANTGLSAAQAKKTFNAAQNLFIGSGCQAGDKLLIAEGSVAFDTTSSSLDPVASAGSPGIANLTCVQSYDPTDPTNAAKWGRVVGANMPVIEINSTTGTGLNIVNTEGVGYVFYQGLEIRCTTNVSAALSAGIGWATNRHPGMVVQNCRFNGTGLASSSGLGTVTSTTNTQNGGLVSKTSFWNSGGLFVDETDGFRIEEVFGGHGGFDIAASREDALINGGASFFSHMFYLHASNTNMQMHRVIVTDATDGLGLRCGGTVTQLVSIDNPVGITAGGKSSDVVAERPDGAPWACDDVVIMGSSKVLQTGSPGGWALEFLNTKIGSYTRNVAAFDFDAFGFDAGANRYFAGTRLDPAQVPTYMLCDKWSGYHMAITGESDSGTDLTNYHLSITNSVLDVLPTGLNGTVSGVTTRSVAPSGYKTRSDIYTALGYANKAELVNAMCFRPDLIGQMAQAICGIALPAMGLTPLYQTASPPSVVVGAPIIYKTAATDLTISTLNFNHAVPSIALLSGITACATLSCADLPTGFSMTSFQSTPSGTCTSGSNQITGVSDTTGVLKGMLVEAKTNSFTNVSLFPAGTVITNIVGSTITCSNNATGNTGGEAIIISSGGRMIRYDGSGAAGTPTIHILETPKDAGMATHTTPFTLSIS